MSSMENDQKRKKLYKLLDLLGGCSKEIKAPVNIMLERVSEKDLDFYIEKLNNL